jgi:hypothetical protein
VKKFLIVLAAGLLTCSIVVAAAASLGLSPNTSMGSGTSIVASCSTSTALTYNTQYNTTIGELGITDVTLTFTGTCTGQTATVTLVGASGAITDSNSTVADPGTSVTVVFNGETAASLVTKFAVLVK